ncbi:MAG: bifunctional riboflavin kinase/FAD synthetase [Eubacteriales bacterium]|nr:bifunctional riboflavin kinase/FAD synthetase [Eubacteriales bacterium]
MEYIKSSEFQLHNSAVALGKFEGIHLGHQLLLHEILKQKENGLSSVVFTFDLPPKVVLSGDKTYSQIFTKDERRLFLERQGIDVLLEHPFTPEFAALTPEEFIEKVLVEKADAKVIVVGADFHFGKKRSGNVNNLREAASKYGYELIVLEKKQDMGLDISSTRIRELLSYGRMEEVKELLGRNYSVYGEVVHGRALGRTIDIPTINQIVEDIKMVPPNGVYVSLIHIGDETYQGVTNIGTKPTVNAGNVKGVETNIFDFNGDLYGKKVEVELLHFCRAEMKFSGVEALKAQMQSDIQFAKKYFQ